MTATAATPSRATAYFALLDFCYGILELLLQTFRVGTGSFPLRRSMTGSCRIHIRGEFAQGFLGLLQCRNVVLTKQ